jgi:phage tail protein X
MGYMPAPGTTTADGRFPRLAGFGAQGQQAARQLEEKCAWLRAEGAQNSARRLARIDQYVGRLSLGDIVTLIDPNLAIDELASLRQTRVRLAHTYRNTVALIPLVGTWIMLGLAAIYYHDELVAHPVRSGTPFLELWQQGFGAGFPTFADVAFCEFTVLIAVVALTVWVHWVEGNATRELAVVADRLYDALDVLAVAIEGGAVRTPENAVEWATAANDIINRAMLETRELAQAGISTIEQARRTLADVQQQGHEFIERVTEEVRGTLVGVQEQNVAAIRAAAEQSQQTMRLLVNEQTRPLIQQLREMLGRFGEQQAAFRGEIVNLAQDVTSIRTAAAELADGALGYAAIAASLTGIADSEREIATQMTAGLGSITTVAAALGEIKDVLIADVHGAMPAMTSGVTEASRGLAEVQRNLAETTGALARSAAALGGAAERRRTGSRFWPPWPFRGGR